MRFQGQVQEPDPIKLIKEDYRITGVIIFAFKNQTREPDPDAEPGTMEPEPEPHYAVS